ncbi:hypothetical protein ABZT04_05670 [Streptomyces sp. NPDC005492]|uniref:hypothetical protein n=1 Tax=Streptomyces sp. NPDC005492 TaxID=3156883 RepID=UPI0033B5E096
MVDLVRVINGGNRLRSAVHPRDRDLAWSAATAVMPHAMRNAAAPEIINLPNTAVRKTWSLDNVV